MFACTSTTSSAPSASGLSGSSPPTTTRTKRSRGSASNASNSSGIALLRDQSPDGADSTVSSSMPSAARTRAAVVGREPRGVEAGEIDAVAEQLGVAGEVQSLHEREVLGVLEQLGVGAPRRRSPRGRTPRPAWRDRVVVGRVETVHGVDHDRDPRQPPDDAAVQPGLRVVRVQDVDLLAPQDAPELARGAHVGGRVHRARRRRERDVADALRLELGHPRSGRADADGAPAEVAHGAELREQEEAEAHVDGRQVRDGRRRQFTGH